LIFFKTSELALMNNFRELEIWQYGFNIGINAFLIMEALPKEVKWGIGQQLTRAAISIPSNIAEGSSRKSVRDFHRFVEIALGSTYELETQLLILKKLKIGDQDFIDETLSLVISEEKMLTAFLKALIKRMNSSPIN
jgi:four helix bundle protein